MTTTVSSHPLTGSGSLRRRQIRRGAALVSGLLALTYIWMFFAIRATELAAEVETTYGAYLFLTVPYVAGAVLLLLLDLRVLWAAGAVVQVAVVALFVTFGAAVFDYPEVADLPLELWVATTLIGQAVLFGLLGFLTLTPVPRD
jgi:hypothetical protein